MPARKKTIKKKAVKSAPKRKSKFSLKRILAPFIVLVAVAGILSFTLLPKSEVLSSQTASDNSPFNGSITISDKGYLKVPIGNSDYYNNRLCNTRSVEMFINPKQVTAPGGVQLMSRTTPSVGGGVFGPYSFWISEDMRLHGVVNHTSASGYEVVSKSPLTVGKNQHIALEYVMLGPVEKQGVYLFVDGKQVAYNPDGKGNIYCPKGGELTIGNPYSPFEGTIDEVRFSTIPRYAPEAYYKVPSEPFAVAGDSANLVGLWHFDGNFDDQGQWNKPFQPVGKYVFNNIKPTLTPTRVLQKTPTPTEARCGNITLESYKVYEGCAQGTYKKADFTCTDGYGYTMESKTCQTQAQFKQDAYDECQTRTATCVSTPTPTGILQKTPTPTYVSPSLFPTKTPTPTITNPTPTGKLCAAKLSYVNTKTACKPFKSGSTTGMNFGCSDGYVGSRIGAACTSATAWYSVASRECAARMTPCK